MITRSKAEIIACAIQLLDPAEARAAEQLVLSRAGRLTPGGLRARAYLDLLLGKDSRPRQDTSGSAGAAGPGPDGTGEPAAPPAPGPQPGAVPAGFAGRVTVTVPLAGDLSAVPGALTPGTADKPGWQASPGQSPLRPDATSRQKI